MYLKDKNAFMSKHTNGASVSHIIRQKPKYLIIKIIEQIVSINIIKININI